MIGNEELKITNDYIKLSTDNDTSAVMHIGEISLMSKLAEIVTQNGGDILEIGFGMHLSADVIQSNPNVTSHTIIEIHPEIYNSALEWAKDKPNTNIIFGDWINILPLSNKKFDGVLHDTHLDPNIPKFLDYVKDNCKIDTIVGFFEYREFNNKLDGYRYKIPEEEYETLPYKKNKAFSINQFELKYTTFNGTNFYKKSKIKNLI
jgi:hypothetical protein